MNNSNREICLNSSKDVKHEFDKMESFKEDINAINQFDS